MMTLAVRMERMCSNALRLAQWLSQHPAVSQVFFPGLPCAVNHQLAVQQFSAGQFGSMVTFELSEGLSAVEALIKNARHIPFCPSLGEVQTTLSHPATTSHRGLSAAERKTLGISDGTIRLSVGIESPEFLQDVLENALRK